LLVEFYFYCFSYSKINAELPRYKQFRNELYANLVLSNSYKTTNDVLSKEITIFAAVQLLLTAPLKMKVKAGSKKGETLSYKTDDYLRK